MSQIRTSRNATWISASRAAQWVSKKHSMVPFVGVAWAIVVGALIGVGGNLGVRGALLVSALPLVVAVVSRSTRGTLMGLAVWLVALGLIRRLIPSGNGTGVSDDPLLLVGPAALGVLFIVSAGRGAFRRATPLATTVLLFSFLALVEAFNPLQGGLLIGLGGLLFVLFPMLAFWVGRSLLDTITLRQLLRLLSLLALLNAIYGLVQEFAGFPSWDARWIHSSGYTALSVGGFDRAFGSFSSAQEYAIFTSVGLVLWVGLFSAGRLLWILFQVASVALLATALVFESDRGALVLTVFALGTMAAARTRLRPTGALVAGAVFILVLYFGVSQFSSTTGTETAATNSASALTSHLVSGIANPTGQESTLPGHFSRLVAGMTSGFTEPVGHGTGSITLAASHLGNAAVLGTELDPSNAAVAFGFVGLMLYLIVALRALGTMYLFAAKRRDGVSIAVLGVGIATLFQWLNGELYSVAWLFWLTLGWVDQRYFGNLTELVNSSSRLAAQAANS